jgi:hypothetical protein
MLVKEFKGHKLSNAATAVVFYYPEVTNGGDLVEDTARMAEDIKSGKRIAYEGKLIMNLYVAFRKAGDPEAVNKSAKEIIEEVDFFNVKELTELNSVIQALMNESPKKD